MNKLAVFFAAALISVSALPCPGFVQTAVSAEETVTEAKNKDFQYNIYADHIEITDIVSQGGDIIIPAEIDGLPVTDWSPSVTVPIRYTTHISASEENPYFTVINDALICTTSGVMIYYVGSGEGYNSRSEQWLEDYQIPDSVRIIGSQAFNNAGFIHSLTIPDSVERLCFGALQATSAVSLTIPASVTQIEGAALKTRLLEKIELAEDNPGYTLIDGVLFTKDGKTLCCYPHKTPATSYSVPEGAESFLRACFSNCQNLTEVTIPASFSSDLRETESIINLTAIHIDEQNPYYKDIDGVVFDHDGKTLVKYPVRLNEDGEYTVPDGTETIAEYAFYGAKFFGVVFPESVSLLERNCMFGTEYRHLKYVKFLNPACEIKQGRMEFGLRRDAETGQDVSTGIIYGYQKSTAQTFATRYEYTFATLETEPGDVNADGAVTAADAVLLSRWLSEGKALANPENADLNSDGILTVHDLTQLKRMLIYRES